jgi:peptidoglycan/LPS O-acetylase OafA/YrhL
MALLAYLKLQKSEDQTGFHDFDLNTTLPIRGLLAFLIVLFHIGQRFYDTPIGIFSSSGRTTVSVFFFISGYGLMTSYRKKGKAYLSNFFKRRLCKLLPLFVVLTLACAIYSCIVMHHSVSEIANNFSRGVVPLPNSWFMYVILYQYVAFYLACKIGRSRVQWVVITAILTLVSMAGMYMAHWNDWWWMSQPSFVFGMTVAAYWDEFRMLLSKYTFAMISSTLIVMSIGIINGRLTLIPESVTRFLFPNLMPLLVVFMVSAYGSAINRITNFCGKISLEIYLIHGLVIMTVDHFGLPWYTYTLCVFIITVPISAIAHRASCLFDTSMKNVG